MFVLTSLKLMLVKHYYTLKGNYTKVIFTCFLKKTVVVVVVVVMESHLGHYHNKHNITHTQKPNLIPEASTRGLGA